jgi:hypothetical protein
MTPIIEIFQTNVDSESIAQTILTEINNLFPELVVNFDLEDCDRILRLVTPSYDFVPKVSAILVDSGYQCEVLPDDI